MSRLYTIVGFLFLLLLWHAMVAIETFSFLPRPVQVMQTLITLTLDGTLLRYTTASLYRVTCGFLLAVATALPLGIVLGSWRVLYGITNPLIQFFRPISPLAWLPLALFVFGIGDLPAIFLIFIASFFPLLVSTMASVASVNETYLKAAACFDFKGVEFFFKIVLMASLPNIIVGLRIAAGIAWFVVVASEMIATNSGLGYLVIEGRNAMRLDYVVAAMIVIGLIGVLLDLLLRQYENMDFVKWGYSKRLKDL